MRSWSLSLAVAGLLSVVLFLCPSLIGLDAGAAAADAASSSVQEVYPPAHVEEVRNEGGGHKWTPSLWSVIPFALMLLAIALVPLFNEHWWENDRNRGIVAALLGIPTLLYVYFSDPGATHRVMHTAEEYASFIMLLGSLFVISGGIVITGNLKGTPVVNTAFLAVGGLVASFIGTTGAAMLLIRPVMSTNAERKHVLHIVLFFIFLVCNCGGCLTPLGDPPLFLGYLKGVPFTWTFGLVKEWAFIATALLVVFFVFDLIQYRRETLTDITRDAAHERPLVVRGAHNFLFLGGVVLAVAWTDVFTFPTREGFMLLMAIGAWFTTRQEYRRHNRFGFGPIREVAVVFAGIFSTMIPALALLQAKGGQLGVETPNAFFWATGALSSFLDNAPTYLSFLALANGITDWAPEYAESCLAFAAGQPAFIGTFAACQEHWASASIGSAEPYIVPQSILTGISLGAVFLGAMTYIGNGPNFMVRAIANEAGVKMPSFFGYILWSAIFLLPLFFVATLLFL